MSATETAAVGIVGGGLAGLALAYELACAGVDDVVVIEGAELGSGVTAASLGGVRQQFSQPLEIELAIEGIAFWQQAEELLEHPCTWHRDGYLFVTGDEANLERLAEAGRLQERLGAGPAHALAAGELGDVVPWLEPSGLVGGVWTPDDGRVNATDGVAGLAAAARARGVRIVTHEPVAEIARQDGGSGSGWRVRSRTRTYEVAELVLASGLGTPALLETIGATIGIHSFKLPTAITEPALPGLTVPLTIDLDSGLCVEREGDGLALTMIDTAATTYTAAEMLDDFIVAAQVRAPGLLGVGIRTTFPGDVDMTADGRPYAGPFDDGLWVFAGFAGHGVVHAPPIARHLATALAGGTPRVDLTPFSPTRDPRAGEREWLDAGRKGRAA